MGIGFGFLLAIVCVVMFRAFAFRCTEPEAFIVDLVLLVGLTWLFS